MAIYEYECKKCKSITDFICKFEDKPKVRCEKCGGTTKRIISVCGWDLKGEGWYNPHNPMQRSRKV